VDIVSFLLRPPPAITLTSPAGCFDALEALEVREHFAASIDRAAAGGVIADRLGYAFLAGYRAALGVLDPSVTRASLCATEEGGAHPRAIRARIIPSDGGYTLTGKKTFATLASAARTLLVVVSEGEVDARNRLRVVRLPARRAGITIRDRPPLAFAPEIPHAEVTFENVHVAPSELLAADGYADVLKPFRTLEDAHVTAAWLGWAVREMAHDHALVEQALASISALRAVSERDASSPETHLVLAGVLAEASDVARACDAGIPGDQARARWLRDRPLLVAGKVRGLRTSAAWARIVGSAV
jgi:acyl-CoA dehydrogenase